VRLRSGLETEWWLRPPEGIEQEFPDGSRVLCERSDCYGGDVGTVLYMDDNGDYHVEIDAYDGEPSRVQCYMARDLEPWPHECDDRCGMDEEEYHERVLGPSGFGEFKL